MNDTDGFRLAEIERNVEEIQYSTARTENLLKEWQGNQKWQINDLRKEVQGIYTTVFWFLGILIALLAYIAYKLS